VKHIECGSCGQEFYFFEETSCPECGEEDDLRCIEIPKHEIETAWRE